MKKSKAKRRAILLNICSDGIFVHQLIDSLTAEINNKYKEFLVIDHETEINKKISDSLPNDVFVVGGKKTMMTANRFGLHFREKNIDARCVLVPACPYNSVPFNDFSSGFGSALKWCVGLGNYMLFARTHSRDNCSIGIIEIAGDDNGWLTAGASSLVSEKGKVLFLTCETIFDEGKLCAAVSKKMKKFGATIIFTSEIIRNAEMKKIGGAAQPVSTALSKIIMKKLNLKSFAMIVDPGKMFDSAHLSKQDDKDGRLAGKAAVRLALRTAKQGTNIIVANRLSFDGKNKLTFEVVPLFEAINTPRKLPKKISAKNLQRFL